MQAACRLGRPDRLGPGTSECHCHRHRRSRNGAAPPGQPAHRPTRPAGRCRRPGRGPGGGPPSLPGPDHTCPGSGVPAAAVLADPDPGQGPPGTGAHLASYAGLAPVTRRSGSSIRGEHVSHSSNKRLKRAMFLSAFASPHSAPPSAGPTIGVNVTKAKRLGPDRPRPGPPPHPGPARQSRNH